MHGTIHGTLIDVQDCTPSPCLPFQSPVDDYIILMPIEFYARRDTWNILIIVNGR